MAHRLEPSLLTQSSLAIAAALSTLQEIAAIVLQSLAVLLNDESKTTEALELLEKTARAVEETQQYISIIQTSFDSDEIRTAHARSLHLIDHFGRHRKRSGYAFTIQPSLRVHFGSHRSKQAGLVRRVPMIVLSQAATQFFGETI